MNAIRAKWEIGTRPPSSWGAGDARLNTMRLQLADETMIHVETRDYGLCVGLFVQAGDEAGCAVMSLGDVRRLRDCLTGILDHSEEKRRECELAHGQHG